MRQYQTSVSTLPLPSTGTTNFNKVAGDVAHNETHPHTTYYKLNKYMFQDLTTTNQRMNRDSADFSEWVDEEFGERETPFMAFVSAVMALGLIVVLAVLVKMIW